jgi:hypothetical protein
VFFRPLSIVCLSSFFVIPVVYGATWRPVTAEELALKASKTDSEADARGLFREVRVLNEMGGMRYPHNVISEYIRLKIFTDRVKTNTVPCKFRMPARAPSMPLPDERSGPMEVLSS